MVVVPGLKGLDAVVAQIHSRTLLHLAGKGAHAHHVSGIMQLHIHRLLLIAGEVAKKASVVQQKVLAFGDVGARGLKNVVLPNARIVGVIHAVRDAVRLRTQLEGVLPLFAHFNPGPVRFEGLQAFDVLAVILGGVGPWNGFGKLPNNGRILHVYGQSGPVHFRCDLYLVASKDTH